MNNGTAHQSDGSASLSLRFSVHSQRTLPPSVAPFAEPVHVDGGAELWMMDVDGEAGGAAAESGVTAGVGGHSEFEEGGSGGRGEEWIIEECPRES